MIVVRVKDNTIGKCDSGKIGDKVTVYLQNENGMEIKKEGIIVEILED